MGSSSNKSVLEVVTIDTDTLKQRLNKLYETARLRQKHGSPSGVFDYLWDLKEKALLEGSKSVEVPKNWLDELDTAINQPSRGH